MDFEKFLRLIAGALLLSFMIFNFMRGNDLTAGWILVGLIWWLDSYLTRERYKATEKSMREGVGRLEEEVRANKDKIRKLKNEK